MPIQYFFYFTIILGSCNEKPPISQTPRLETSTQQDSLGANPNAEVPPVISSILNANDAVVSAPTSTLRVTSKLALALMKNRNHLESTLTDVDSHINDEPFSDGTSHFRIPEAVATYFESANEVLCALSQIGYTDEHVVNNVLYWVRIRYRNCSLKTRRHLFYDAIVLVNREINKALDVKFWIRLDGEDSVVHAKIAEGVSTSNPYGIFKLQFVRFHGLAEDTNTPYGKVYLEAKREHMSKSAGIYYWSNSGQTHLSFSQLYDTEGNSYAVNNMRGETYANSKNQEIESALHFQMAYNNNTMLIKDLSANTPLISCQKADEAIDVNSSECSNLYSAVIPPLGESKGFDEKFVEYYFPELPENTNLLFDEGKYVENIPALNPH